jgi:hypothetical protein
MPETMAQANNNDRLRAILVLFATIGTIAFNTIASMGYVNGVSPAAISDKYPTPLTPAGYAFSIWSLIYLGLIAYSIYQLLPANLARLRGIRSLYIMSCVLNCAWIYVWHYERIGVSLAVILMLWAVLMLIIYNIRGHASTTDTWILQATFGIYAGWVTAASLVNFMVMLAWLDVDIGSRSILLLTLAFMLLASAAAVIVRLKLANFFYPLAIAWALTAIAIAHSGVTSIVVTAAVGVVVCLITTGTFVTKLKDATSE